MTQRLREFRLNMQSHGLIKLQLVRTIAICSVPNQKIRLSIMLFYFNSTGGEDYTSINYTILITDDSSLMRNFTFTVIDDSEVEGNETLFLEMSSNNLRVTVATPTSLVTIVDVYKACVGICFK